MLRATSNILARLPINGLKCSNSDCSLEFVRWRRKPRWLPVAKSKMFRVPERKKQTEEERAELMRLHNNYKTQMRSLRLYLREEAQRLKETSTADHIVLTEEQEELEYQNCIQANEAWNQKIAAEREQRLQQAHKERAAHIQERLELAREREEANLERIESIVKHEKELSKTYVTRENLEAAIEHALANPVDYNFSIDLKGNMYRGRTTLPSGGGGSTDGQQQQAEETSKLEAAAS